MHVLVFYSLIILITLRLVGVVIGVDFYIRRKTPKYGTYALAWFLWVCAGILPLISLMIANQIILDFFLIYNIILTSFALILLIKGILAYFYEVTKKILILIFILLILISHLFYVFLGSQIATTITSIISQFFWYLGISLPFIRWKIFAQQVNRHLWYIYVIIFILGFSYIPIITVILTQGLGFGLYYADNIELIIFNYTYAILLTVVLQLLIFHLEYTISKYEQSKMKDMYSHNLGNALQAIYTSLDLLSSPNINKNDEDELKMTLNGKLQEAADLLKEIREL